MSPGDGGKIFYAATIAFSFGVFVESFFDLGLSGVGLVAVIGLAVGLLGRRSVDDRPLSELMFFALVCFLFALGVLRMEYAESRALDPTLESLVGSAITLDGVIRREPEERETSVHLYVHTDHGLVLVTTELGGDWRYGDRVSVRGSLEKPESFKTDLGRTFDYPGYLLARGVGYTIRYAKVELAGSGEGLWLFERIFTFKQAFMDRVERLLPEPAAGLGEGLLLGAKRALGTDLEETFRKTGIIHIVVLSGYNMAIVSGFILFLLGMLFGRRISAVAGIIGILLFAVMVGLSATVVRAAIMGVLVLLIGLTGRIYLVLRGLLLAGFLMLVYNPYSLAFDVGFQLSFLATLGLIVVAPYLDERLQRVPNTWFSAREFLVATLATQIFVLPILLYQIGEFSVVAVIVNMLVLPMVPVAMLLTFVTGMVGFVSASIAAPLAYITYLSLSYIIVMAEWFGALPFAAFVVPPFPFYVVPLGYLAIVLMLWWLNQEPDPLKGWTIEEDPA